MGVANASSKEPKVVLIPDVGTRQCSPSHIYTNRSSAERPSRRRRRRRRRRRSYGDPFQPPMSEAAQCHHESTTYFKPPMLDTMYESPLSIATKGHSSVAEGLGIGQNVILY